MVGQERICKVPLLVLPRYLEWALAREVEQCQEKLETVTDNISDAFTFALHKINLSSKKKLLVVEDTYENNLPQIYFYKKHKGLKSFFISPVIYKNLEGIIFITPEKIITSPVK